MSLISVGLNLSAGSEVVVYTVPKGYIAVWNLMYLTNTGTLATVSVDWYQAKTSTHVKVLDTTSLGAKDYIQLNGQGSGVVMDEGDQVHANTAIGSTFSIICTFDLIRKP